MSTVTLARGGLFPVRDEPAPAHRPASTPAGHCVPVDHCAPTDHRGTADHEAAVYRFAVRCGEIGAPELVAAELGLPVAAVFSAVTKLVELHLLRTEPGADGADRLVPIGPQVAAGTLISPIERAMYERRDLADRLRDRIETITRPAEDPEGDPVGSIDRLTGPAQIRGLFKLAAEECRDELIVLRPGLADEDLLDELLEPCFSVLERGVPVRMAGPHRSRAGFAARSRARRLLADGAHIRTLSEVPQAAVVFDRSLAVMFGAEGPDGVLTARRVRDGNVVRFLVEMFGQLWESATPFVTEEPGYAEAIDDLQQSIARLMAQGLTDEVVARRLGMSVRTCRRHIAALLQNLDAVSRFQAGVQAAGRFPMSGGQAAACGA